MKFKLLLLLPLLFLSFSSFSQEKTNTKIDFPENVNAPLTSTEKEMIKEVYKSEAKSMVFDNESFLKDIKHLLRNRIVIYEENNAKGQKKCKLLSEVALFDDYNKNLERDKTFDLENFNPLKYKLDFFANGTYLYRIDGTNYFIQVTSQHRKI